MLTTVQVKNTSQWIIQPPKHSQQRQAIALPWTLHAFVTFATFRNTLKKLCEFFLVGKIPVESQACRTSGLLYLYQPLFILSLEEILKTIITDSTHPPSKPIISTKGTGPASWPTLHICPGDAHMCRQWWCVISCMMSCLLTHSHCKGIQHHLYRGILCNSMAQSSPERQKGWEDSRQSRKISIELENILSIWYYEHAHIPNPLHPLSTLHCKELDRNAGRCLLHLHP